MGNLPAASRYYQRLYHPVYQPRQWIWVWATWQSWSVQARPARYGFSAGRFLIDIPGFQSSQPAALWSLGLPGIQVTLDSWYEPWHISRKIGLHSTTHCKQKEVNVQMQVNGCVYYHFDKVIKTLIGKALWFGALFHGALPIQFVGFLALWFLWFALFRSGGASGAVARRYFSTTIGVAAGTFTTARPLGGFCADNFELLFFFFLIV